MSKHLALLFLLGKQHSILFLYPLRSLGIATETNTELEISEEERDANFHVIGAPKQGKSKFLEYNIRKDIDMGNGLMLIDPSDRGETYKAVLEYCASVNHQKVLIIDPSKFHIHKKYPTIQPIHKKRIKESVAAIMEVASILFGAKETETPRIRRYLSALVRVLAKGDFTLYESQYFADFEDSALYRKSVIHRPPAGDRDVITLKNVFRSPYSFEQYFSSTVNRLDAFWEEPLSLVLAANSGIDFNRMVADGWVILVNLFADDIHLNKTDSQLLGILLINQVIQAIDILNYHGWRGVYYLYIDEAGRFATPQIDDVLTNKRKSGLRLMFVHHFFEQFKDKQVLQAIKQNTGIKVMFNLPEPQDRLEMIKSLGYGGDITPAQATFANQDLPARHAIIKKGKEPPRRIRIPDVPSVTVSKEHLDSYINQILEQPWYLTKEQIKKQIEARLHDSYHDNLERQNAKTPQSQQASNNRKSKSNSKTNNKTAIKSDSESVKGKSAFSQLDKSGEK
jgi:hypothetical protein